MNEQKRERLSTALRYAQFIMMLTLFLIVLLLAEMGVNMRSDVFFHNDSSQFVYALALIAGAAGYMLFPLGKKITARFKENLVHIVMLLVLVLFFWCTVNTHNIVLFVIFTALTMLLCGYIGGLTFYYLCLALAGSRFLFRITGISLFISTAVLFTVRYLCTVSSSLILIMLPALALYAHFIYSFPLNYSEPKKMKYSAAALDKKCTFIIIIIASMSMLLSFGGNAMITDLIKDPIEIADWPKLFYALFMLIGGLMGDKSKKLLAVSCLVAMLLCSVCPILLRGQELLADIGRSIQYATASLCLVYMTTSPIQTAQHTDYPALWAGIGRYERNLCVALYAVPLKFLDNQIPDIYVLITDVLLVALCAAAMLASSKIKHDVIDRTDDAYNEFKHLSAARFAQSYALDEHEAAVASQLIYGERSIKRIAFRLYIPEKRVFAILASVYEKTSTDSLESLLHLYYMS